METVRLRDKVGGGGAGKSSFIFFKSVYKMEAGTTNNNVSHTAYTPYLKTLALLYLSGFKRSMVAVVSIRGLEILRNSYMIDFSFVT